MKGLATPKKQTTKSKTGKRRSHLLRKLQKAVNRRSPVKVGKIAKGRVVAKKGLVQKTSSKKPASTNSTKKSEVEKKPTKKRATPASASTKKTKKES